MHGAGVAAAAAAAGSGAPPARRAPDYAFLLQTSATVQSLVLAKDRFTDTAAAKAWIRSRSFRADRVDETDETIRFLQREPGEFARGTFRTVNLSEGVRAVSGRLREEHEARQIPMAVRCRLTVHALHEALDAAVIEAGKAGVFGEIREPDEDDGGPASWPWRYGLSVVEAELPAGDGLGRVTVSNEAETPVRTLRVAYRLDEASGVVAIEGTVEEVVEIFVTPEQLAGIEPPPAAGAGPAAARGVAMPAFKAHAEQSVRFLGEVQPIRLSEPEEPAIDGEPASSWVQVFKLGDFRHPMGDFQVDDAFLASVVTNFLYFRARSAEVPVDYEHNSALAGAVPEASRAAGWVQALDHRQGLGLWALVDWTEDAAAHIKAREYRYISPEFHPDFSDETGTKLGPTLLAVGLVNRPHLRGMEPVQLKEQRDMTTPATGAAAGAGAAGAAAAAAAAPPPVVAPPPGGEGEGEGEGEGGDKAVIDRLTRLEQQIGALAELCRRALPAEGAGQEPAMGAQGGAPASAPAAGAQPNAATRAAGAPTTAAAVPPAFEARVRALEAENTRLKASEADRAASDEVMGDLRKGRFVRASYDAMKGIRLASPDQYRKLVASLPENPLVNSTEIGEPGERQPEGESFEAAVEAVARAKGIGKSVAWKEVAESKPALLEDYYRRRRTAGMGGRAA